MALSKNAIHLLKQRYCHKNETPGDLFKRVGNALALGDIRFEKKLIKSMEEGYFLPNSPCIRNAGTKKGMLHACFVLPVEDTMDSISDAIKHMMIIFKNGGGIGMNFSKLRPKDAVLSGGGSSSGVVSFMGLFDHATDCVKQGGFRRGALMGVLNFEHAEIMEFIRSKISNKLTNFNISVMVSDIFMQKVEKGEMIDLKNPQDNTTWGTVNAKTIFDVMCFCAWNSGDPGFLFYDRINKDNKLFPKLKIKCTNPCVTGNTLIAVADGRNAISIQQLTKENKDVPVYSRSIDGKVEIKMGRNPRLTQQNATVYKVILDDNSSIEATDNHKFMMKDGSYKELKDLKRGDCLAPFNSFDNNKYRQIAESGQIMIGGRRRNRRQYRLITDFNGLKANPKTERIHHKDFNSTNDSISNLEVLDKNAHNILHTQNMIGKKNPYHRMSKEWKFNFASHKGKENGKYIDIENDELIKLANSLYDKYGYISKKLWMQEASKLNVPKNVWSKYRFGKWSNFKSLALSNHKVLEVKYVGRKDVYNLTVDDNHNYCVITSYQDNKYINSSGVTIKNCGEVPLPDYGACCLGSINLSKFVKRGKFDFDEFKKYVELATRALMNNNAISWYPLTQIDKTMKELNPIGVGVMGFADALIKMEIKYDSDECLQFIDEIGKVYKDTTDKLAAKCFWKRIIAPTGSLSIIADCSSGIEPIFETTFERHLTVGIMEETRELYKSKFVRTAHQISPEWHLKIQAQWQKWCDGSISKTINLPNEASVDDVKRIYVEAWKMGVKGITVFRDGCKEGVFKKKQKCDGDTCTL